MASPSEIKAAIERVADVVKQRPSEGQKTKSILGEITQGLQFVVNDGQFTIVSDAAKAMGGENTGPSAGTLARAGLAACTAIGYAMIFARRDISFDKLSVEIIARVDQGSYLGVDGAVSGYQDMRCLVNLESDADPAVLTAAMDDADAMSVVLQSFLKPTPVVREVNIRQKQDAAD